MFQNMRERFSKSMTGKKLVIVTASALALLFVLGFVTYEGTKASVTLVLDGEEKKIRTHADNVQELLLNHDIELRDEDLVVPSKGTKIFNNMNVTWKPAKQITLVMGDEEKKVYSTGSTVRDVIRDADIDLKEHDQVKPDLGSKLKPNMKIAVEKAFQITYQDGIEEKKAWTTSTTVADFLKQQDIQLDDLDRVEPSKEDLITMDTDLKIIRVEKVTDVVEEPVDYAVVTKKDNDLTKGKEKIIEAGEKGRVAKHFEVVLENGKEVSRKLVKEETIQESKDRIVAVGTKVISSPVSRSNSNASGGSVAREFTVTSTAYTAYCNGCSGYTTTGMNLRANPDAKVIAVDPSVIPLGTRVYVEGYGYAVAADTGGHIVGNRIDVFFPTKAEAYRWGRKTVKIKILK